MITRTDFTRQYEHVAVIAHGAHPEYRLEFDAPVSTVAADLGKNIVQGSIVSLNADGKYVLGCGKGTGVNFPVPMISMKNFADPDVSSGISGASYRTSTYSAIGGVITAIPCTGSYEFETTEFDQTATYAPNDGLIPQVVGGAQTGLITLATAAPGGAAFGSASATVLATAALVAGVDEDDAPDGTYTLSTTTAEVTTVSAAAGAAPYVGFVSKAPYTASNYNHKRLSFFANFIPCVHLS